MLVLSRRVGESIIIGGATVEVLESSPSRVRLGVTAAREVPILRSELLKTTDAIPKASVAKEYK